MRRRPGVRNPSTKATGLTTVGLQWLLGGYEYGGKLDQVLHGWVESGTSAGPPHHAVRWPPGGTVRPEWTTSGWRHRCRSRSAPW
ncbi:hypothetical protein GCM10023194_31190 [Planotetraspora phitsanulokensis]|uniref:Uncharacterized protein n=1 Tax=Planotetraspora phitsanulokensis TaxID=575192 RepID=A0A8J3TZP8_9ACTN|nr:hypothetical protein Pph01_07460 [Planotetraspora phitsanulokensis]